MADIGKTNGAITINIGVAIADETIELCLSVIRYWLNQNPDKRIIGGYRNENGTVDELRIESRREQENNNEGGQSNEW